MGRFILCLLYIEVGNGGGGDYTSGFIEGEWGRSCYLTVDLATAASQNGFSTYHTIFFFLRKSIFFGNDKIGFF
jgi:hypothetical protein